LINPLQPAATKIWDAGEPLPRIVGRCSDASMIGTAAESGKEMATLQILAIDRHFTWARDRRGFYRLGAIIGFDPSSGSC